MEHNVAGPRASLCLADWGAEVIKVEPPTGEAGRGIRSIGGVSTTINIGAVAVRPENEASNRNKKSLALDLKKKTGRDILCQLVQKADVFLSNYQLSSLKKLRLDYDTLSQLNPRLVYAIISGYGTKGPDKDEGAYYYTAAWARTGMQNLVTLPGAVPPRSPHGMGDSMAAIAAVAGILGALFHQERTGRGEKVEVSLFQTALWSIFSDLQPALSGMPRGMEYDRTNVVNPLINVYPTKDNRWLQLGMFQPDPYWPSFCQAIERPKLENDPRFNTMESRRENCQELIRLLDEIFLSKTLEQWTRLCREHGLIFSPVQTVQEVVTDPQALANDYFIDLKHPAGSLKVLAAPAKFNKNPALVRTPAPELGQNTEEILLDLGYSWEDIAGLKEQEVIP